MAPQRAASRFALVALVVFLGSALACAQDLGVRISEGKKVLTLDHVLNRRASLQPETRAGLRWHPDGKRFTWVQRKAGKLVLMVASVAGEEGILLQTEAWERTWAAAGIGGKAPAISSSMTWNEDGSLRLLRAGALYRISLQPLTVTRLLQLPQGAAPVAFTADDRQVSFVKAFNVWVKKADGTEVQVTKTGHDDLTHGIAVSRREMGIKDGMWWDPSGRRLAFYREDLRPIGPYPHVDFTARPARRVHGRYPMAGRKGSIVQVGVYDSRRDSLVWLETDPRRDEYLTNITWGPKGQRIYVAHVNRGQDSMELTEYAAKTGRRIRILFTENDEQWTEPEHGPVFFEDGQFLWFSSREGYRHLYLHRRDGTLIRRVTKGPFDVSAFKGFDGDGNGFFFETTGPHPRHKHLYHSNLVCSQRAVTKGRGQHDAQVAPGGAHVLDVHSHLELPLAIDLLSIEGRLVRRVHEAANPLSEFRMGTHRFFEIASSDGHPLYGHVIFPPDPEPGRRYPVLHYVYGGPHAQLVTDRWLGGRGRWLFWLHHMAATRGYVVLRLDNRGTPHRGIEFEQVIHRRLGTCEVEDQTRALEHVLSLGLADPKRVGVHGRSYGGFMTLSLMTRAGNYYRAGVAGAPVTDWAYYETGYGERYMDTPDENPDGYRVANPGTHVKNLEGRLLVVHGTSDVTVVWQNTLDFLKRCIDAGVPVETMVYPGQAHGLRGKAFAHFLPKMTRFFDRELGGGKGRGER